MKRKTLMRMTFTISSSSFGSPFSAQLNFPRVPPFQREVHQSGNLNKQELERFFFSLFFQDFISLS